MSGLAQKLHRRVEIELAGKKWPLLITYGVLLDCHVATGIDMLNTLRPWTLSALLIRTLIHNCLLRSGCQMTAAEIGSQIGRQNLTAVRRKVADAFAASMPDPVPVKARDRRAEEDDEDKRPPKIQTWPEIWATARIRFGLTDEDWLGMTRRQFDALQQATIESQRPLELMIANLTAHLVNFSYRAPERNVSMSRFMLHPDERLTAEELPPSGEQIMKVFSTIGAKTQ
jgi:hypothetical protein